MDNNIVKVALDAIKGKQYAQYSAAETSETIRNALIELNGGSTKLNARDFRPGKPVFDLVEILLPAIINEGIANDPVLMSLCEYRNIADGDEAKFTTKGENDLIVADAAAGIQGVRRQRIPEGEAATIKTTAKAVRVYEDVLRLMSGRVDFNEFVDMVGKAFTNQLALDALACLNNISASTAGLSDKYVKSGSFTTANMDEIIDHVEAASGTSAKICGTRGALKKVADAVVSDDAKNDIYNFGYYGKYSGTPMLRMKQAHKPGTDVFALSNTKVFVIAGDDKPIKIVNEGTGIMNVKEATDNADLTQEYVYIQPVGVGLVLNSKIGVYDINA